MNFTISFVHTSPVAQGLRKPKDDSLQAGIELISVFCICYFVQTSLELELIKYGSGLARHVLLKCLIVFCNSCFCVVLKTQCKEGNRGK